MSVARGRLPARSVPMASVDAGEGCTLREWRALHEELGTISGRLEAIEEAVGELATRPIAEFDVTIKERGQK